MSVPYASLSTSATQTVTSTTVAYPVAFDVEDAKHGIGHSTVTNNSRVTILTEGAYIFDFSAIADDTAADKSHLDLWFAVDGKPVANSNSRVEIASKEVEMTVTTSVLLELFVGQYVQLMYRGDTTTVRMVTTAAGTNPTRPVSPAVILTVTMIGNYLDGIQVR
jgi:ribosomal protein S8